MPEIKYKRILLKLSGEALAGDKKTGVDAEVLGKICDQIKELVKLGTQVAIVVGGGNFWRGKYGHQMERTTSDYMGMLATTMNGLALQDALEARQMHTRVQIEAEVILLAKTIDGVYSADPKENKNAKKYNEITYLDILNKDLKVMDSTATSLCRDNKIPLIVFGINEPENMVKIVRGENIGTIVK